MQNYFSCENEFSEFEEHHYCKNVFTEDFTKNEEISFHRPKIKQLDEETQKSEETPKKFTQPNIFLKIEKESFSLESKLNGLYSHEIPQKQRGVVYFICGNLGSGKSSLVNFLMFENNLQVVNKGSKWVLDVSEELKKELKGECLIVHPNFIEYIGDLVETVQKPEDDLILNEIHLDFKSTISESDFKKCFQDVNKKNIKNQIFQVVIPVFELKQHLFQNSVLSYIRSIDEIITNIIKNENNLAYNEVLNQFELIISKGSILENKLWVKMKLQEILDNFPNFFSVKKSYFNILCHFINMSDKISIFFGLDKEASFLEIINQYDNISL